MTRVLPFPALVGQEHVKRCLLMLAVNPFLGGALLRGEKGTAKSTAARGLSRLLPDIDINRGCPYRCDPDDEPSWCDACRERGEAGRETRRPTFETLPLGISEDQLLGTIDLEHALKHGERRFEPGLLARVNRGILYVDEVNLLDDHIVDLLLDAAATGVNVVAREGVQVAHPARFVLVGTMNPEEGSLRPQLLDRFGLSAEIRSLDDPETRADIVERTLAFETNPTAFQRRWAEREVELRRRIADARLLLPRIRPERALIEAVARLSVSLGVDGHRPDILMMKAAVTSAALDGRPRIEAVDLERAAELVYPHRLKRRPFEETALDRAELRERARQAFPAEKKSPPPGAA